MNDYILLYHYTALKLSEEVTNYLRDGWALHSGTTVTLHEEGDTVYAQAMTR